MSMSGRSKNPPKGEAKPLGTSKSKKSSSKKSSVEPEFTLGSIAEEVVVVVTEKVVAPQIAVEVVSEQTTSTEAQSLEQEKKIMESVTLALKPSSPKSSSIQYGIAGRRGSVRFSKTLFAVVPESLDVVLPGLAEPKRRETKEERKARLAAQPKKTKAEKIAAMQARLDRAKAKLAAEQAAAQPEAVAASA